MAKDLSISIGKPKEMFKFHQGSGEQQVKLRIKCFIHVVRNFDIKVEAAAWTFYIEKWIANNEGKNDNVDTELSKLYCMDYRILDWHL